MNNLYERKDKIIARINKLYNEVQKIELNNITMSYANKIKKFRKEYYKIGNIDLYNNKTLEIDENEINNIIIECDNELVIKRNDLDKILNKMENKLKLLLYEIDT